MIVTVVGGRSPGFIALTGGILADVAYAPHFNTHIVRLGLRWTVVQLVLMGLSMIYMIVTNGVYRELPSSDHVPYFNY